MALFNNMPELAWDFLKLQENIITAPANSRYSQNLQCLPNGVMRGLPYYMSATVSWLFLEALTGVVPDLDHQRLQLGPQPIPGSDAIKIPIFLPSSWFMVDYTETDSKICLWLTPIRKIKPFHVSSLVLSLKSSQNLRSLLINNKKVSPYKHEDNFVEIPVSFDPGAESLSLLIIRKNKQEELGTRCRH